MELLLLVLLGVVIVTGVVYAFYFAGGPVRYGVDAAVQMTTLDSNFAQRVNGGSSLTLISHDPRDRLWAED